MIRRFAAWLTYRRFMARSRRAEARAISTREIGRIRAQRRAVVRAALEAGR